MIRFGAVLTVVLVALGLLLGGVVTNNLLLVYLSIAVAALAAVMLTVGVVIWRGDVFGDAPAATREASAGEATTPAATKEAPAGEVAAPAATTTALASEVAASAAAAPAGRGAAPTPASEDAAPASEIAVPASEIAVPASETAVPVSETAVPAREDAPSAATTAGSAGGRPEALAPAGPATTGRAPARGDRGDLGGLAIPPTPAPHPERAQRQEAPPLPENSPQPEPSPRPEPSPPPLLPTLDWPRDPQAPRPERPDTERPESRPPEPETPAGPAARPTSQGPAWAGFWQRTQTGAADGTVSDQPRERAGAERAPSAEETSSADEARRANEATKAAVAAATAALRSGELAETAEPGPPAQDAAPADAAPGTTAADGTATPAEETGTGTGAESTPGSAPGGEPRRRSPDTEVIIVQGIGRYHRSGCILIRFLGSEDLESMTLRAAEESGCVACKACRPEQQLADD